MPKRGVGLTAGLGAVLVLVFAAWLQGQWGSGFTTRVVDDLGLLGFGVFASVCCFRAARRSRGRQRAAWFALAAGLGGWSAGEGVWCYYELWQRLPQSPFPSPADAGFLLFPVGAAAALLLFPTGRRSQSRTGLLDGVIVAGSLFLVSWVTVLGRVYQAGGADPFAFVVSLAYPVGDLVLVTVAVLMVSRARTAQRLTLALLTAGITLMALSDSVFAYLIATNAYVTGSLMDVGWLAAFLLFGLAAMSSTDEPSSKDRVVTAPGRGQLWLPYVPLGLAAVVGLPLVLRDWQSGAVLGVALLLVVVVLVRQFVTVAENRKLLGTVAHQAFHDPLTGLANRALFTDRLDHAVQLQRRDMRPLAVLSLDLDDFKLVNDSLGHPAGDDLLIRVAERLVGCLRGSDTVARLGGDEFAVLIEEGADSPSVVAERVGEAFRAPFVIDGHTLTVRPSIGLASASADAAQVSAEGLLKQADVAMYSAKRAGAGGVQLFRADMRLADLDELSLRQDLAKVVAAGDIEVAYQPIIDVATGEIRGGEALARWHHPVHGQIPPLRFIPMAEHAGLAAELGIDILDKALAELASWVQPVDAPPLRIAVNLSAQQLIDLDFPAQTRALLARHRVPASQLILEITEGALLTDVEAAGRVAADLHAIGVHLALDDFGIGYSSLAHLSTFPLRILKIDRAFVEPLDTQPAHRAFFAAVLQLGRSLGLEIVAEGVERPQQLAALRELGCDLAQGYYLGRPVDGAAIRKALHAQATSARREGDLRPTA